MKNIIAQQLNRLFFLTGDTPSTLAKKIGMQRPSVSNWKSEHVWMPLKQVYKLLEIYPGLRLEWLMLNKGEAFEEDSDADLVVKDSPVRYNNCIECRIKDGKIEVLDRELVLCRAEVSCLNQEVGRLKRSNGQAFRNENERNLSVGKKPKRYPNLGGGE